MTEILVIILGCFLVAFVSSFLCWVRFCSPEMVEIFGPAIPAGESRLADANYLGDCNAEANLDAERAEQLRIRRHAGFVSEVTRTAMIAIISIAALPFFISTVSLRSVYTDRAFQAALLAVLLASVVWNFYLGPRAFALRHAGNFEFRSHDHFRKYRLPYMVWTLYPVAVWGGIGLLALFMIVNSITIDLRQLNSYLGALNNTPFTDLQAIQIGALRLVHFGNWIATASQKYFITCVLVFIYVIVEQKSTMRYTILNSSIDRMKTGVWIGFLLTIGFALIYLPAHFENSHRMLNHALETSLAQPLAGVQHLSDVMDLQQFLEDHDIRWLLLSIVTGYGNVVSFVIIGAAIFLWRTYLQDFPLQSMLQLVLPAYVVSAAVNFSRQFWIDPRDKKRTS